MSWIWGPLRAKTRSQGLELAKLYDRLTTYFTALWICYPIIWIIGPSGFKIINQTVETLLFCIVPFFSKVGFSVLDLHGLRNLHSSETQTTIDNLVERTFNLLGSITAPRKPHRLRFRK